MDDLSFQTWSDALFNFRKTRSDTIKSKLGQSVEPFGPPDFYQLASDSLNSIISTWFELEQESLNKKPGSATYAEIDRLRQELDSVIDFEIEAVSRDLAKARTTSPWEDAAVTDAQSAFDQTVSDVRKKFALKINAISGVRKSEPDYSPAGVLQMSYSGSSGSSGAGLLGMFILGLVLGGAPAFYFWEGSKKVEKKYQDERSQLLNEQRVLQDNMSLLQESFAQLANGKMMNLRQLDQAIRQIQVEIADRKQEAETEYTRSRERLVKKIPAGSRLDDALQTIETDKKRQMDRLDQLEASRSEPLLKQQKLLKDLLGR